MSTRVCHVITRLILGGAQENTLLTVRGLHEDSDYDVDLVTGPALGPEGELIEDARSFGIDPVIVDPMRRSIHPWRDTKTLLRLRELFRERDYDIVHTHSSKAGILGRWAAREAGVPWIFHTIHGLPYHRYQSVFEYELYRTLERATATVTHEIQTVCDRMAEKATAAGVQPIDRYKTVYSGMVLDPFLEVPEVDSEEATAHKREWGFDEDHFVFGKIARLFHLKGHKYCLKAFARVARQHDHVRLLLVGNGILREDLEAMCRELGIEDRVVFAGLVPYREIPDTIGAMDALVHTSLREGLARVIPQAQAAGRPVISYDVDGAPEAIDHRETGMLAPPKSMSPLVDSMLDVVEDEALRSRLIEKGREWVTPRYHWEHMVSEIKSSYERLPGVG
jgi:glycosyltransferase involved in cell wall biosynthesis